MRHTTRITVRYGETDQMGMAHHANHLLYFEQGRTTMMRELGCSYAELEKGGTILPVIEAHCLYRAPARYEDDLDITTIVEKVTTVKVRFRYEIHKVPDGPLIAEGYTVLGCLDRNGKPKPLPDPLAAALTGKDGTP